MCNLAKYKMPRKLAELQLLFSCSLRGKRDKNFQKYLGIAIWTPAQNTDYFLAERIRGWMCCGSGQPGLAAGNPAHSRGVETRWSVWSFSTQAILRFILYSRLGACCAVVLKTVALLHTGYCTVCSVASTGSKLASMCFSVCVRLIFS